MSASLLVNTLMVALAAIVLATCHIVSGLLL